MAESEQGAETGSAVSQEDLDAVAEQLGRVPRGVLEISYRTPDGRPAVVKTAPRLPDGTPFPTTARLTGRWMRGRLPNTADFTRGIPFLHKRVRQSVERRKAEKFSAGFQTAYCAETVAITYEEMGLLETEKHSNWFDPGSFWSGDTLPLRAGYRLGDEISVLP